MTASTRLGWQNDRFFFKVRQEFIQEFACDQSWILSFSVFRVAPTWKRLHQKIKTQSGIHSWIRSDSFTVFYPNVCVCCTGEFQESHLKYWNWQARSYLSSNTQRHSSVVYSRDHSIEPWTPLTALMKSMPCWTKCPDLQAQLVWRKGWCSCVMDILFYVLDIIFLSIFPPITILPSIHFFKI
jgi:hypothetical protein